MDRLLSEAKKRITSYDNIEAVMNYILVYSRIYNYPVNDIGKCLERPTSEEEIIATFVAIRNICVDLPTVGALSEEDEFQYCCEAVFKKFLKYISSIFHPMPYQIFRIYQFKKESEEWYSRIDLFRLESILGEVVTIKFDPELNEFNELSPRSVEDSEDKNPNVAWPLVINNRCYLTTNNKYCWRSVDRRDEIILSPLSEICRINDQ